MEVVWFIIGAVLVGYTMGRYHGKKSAYDEFINTLADEAVKMRHKVEADIRRQAEQTGKEVS